MCLQVAIALLGSPAVVVLDEPSSGLDPVARRGLWHLIRAAKGSAAVLLTTHHMDEADLLADRVAILAQGRVAAEGTPLQLKVRGWGGGGHRCVCVCKCARARACVTAMHLP